MVGRRSPRAARRRRRRLHRTWGQRLVLLTNALVVVACLAGAGALLYVNRKASQITRVVIDHGATRPLPPLVSTLPVGGAGAGGNGSSTGTSAPLNFLVVGSDSRACIDPRSDRAGRFIQRGDTGQQSDTIMILRVDPGAEQAAILSFPRDLLVRIAGTNRSNKINSAFNGGNVNRLVQTIELNFSVPVDHYVEIDFCAFQNIVDAVGGIKVPFAYPTRDLETGLDVPSPGCITFDGWSALDYARSRHYEWSTDGGRHWKSDGTADRGRITRQQDLIKRVMRKAIDRGARRPQVATKLLNAALKGVKLDAELKVNDLLEVAQQLRAFDPDKVRTFRIDGVDEMVGDQAVIRPIVGDKNTKAILAVFRGEARLSDAPSPDAVDTSAAGPTTTLPVVGAQARSTTTTTTGASGASGASGATGAAGAQGQASAAPTASGATSSTSTIATSSSTSVVDVEQKAVGYAPPDDPTCR